MQNALALPSSLHATKGYNYPTAGRRVPSSRSGNAAVVRGRFPVARPPLESGFILFQAEQIPHFAVCGMTRPRYHGARSE
jgi:hypothetical protein